MPNQFYPRNYFGYPYPQPNMFPYGADAYNQNPYPGTNMQPPYSPYTPYADPASGMPRPQLGYPASAPYDPSIMPQPPIPPAYAAPFMQMPGYGMETYQNPYMGPYQAARPDMPQYSPYYAQPNQYWGEYPTAPYPPQYPVPENPYAGFDPSDSVASANRESVPMPPRNDAEAAYANRARERAIQEEEALLEEQRRRRAHKKHREALIKKAEREEAERIKAQRKAAREKEAAREKTLKKEVAQQEALQQDMAKQQARIREAEERLKAIISKNRTSGNNANKSASTDLKAEAAASFIDAFHKTAKSVNEGNLNAAAKSQQAASQNQAKPKANQKKSDAANEKPAASESANSKNASYEDIELPSISIQFDENGELLDKKDDKKEKEASAPNAEDVVVVSEEAVAETVAEDGTAETTEFVAVSEAQDEASDAEKDTATETEGTESASSDTKEAPEKQKRPVSPIAIVGLVFGIVGIVLAAVAPIVNILGYGAIVVGVIALIVSAISLFSLKKGTKSGKPAAIAGIVCALIAIIAAIVLHFAMPADSHVSSSSGNTPTSNIQQYMTSSSSSSAASDNYSSTDDGNLSSSDSSYSYGTSSSSSTSNNNNGLSSTQGGGLTSMDVTPMGSHEDLAVGTSVEYSNGLLLSVDSIETGLTNSAGSKIVCVTVTYVNNGTAPIDYNSFDWKVEETNGTQKTYAIYPSGENELNSGELAAGSSVTGNLYFEGPIKKVIYEANYWNSESNATWKA